MEALWTSERLNLVRYDSLQPHYNLVHRAEFERELEPVCETYGLGVIPYSPLAGGFLTGKYRKGQEVPESARAGGAKRYFTERNWGLLDQIETIAKDKGCTISQIALAWLLSRPVVTSPIIGPRNLDQLEDNLGAADTRLTEEEMETLNKASDWRKHED
jgi:aryl-alcohol dehydrogenase-like predicted oxidoreductase